MNHVRYRGEYVRDCPYCGSEGTRVARGMLARELSAEAMLRLLNRGWARSGTWVYLPVNAPACCPQYQIRADARSWRPSKNLRGKWRKFVKAIKERPELEAAAGDGAGCSAGGEGFGRWTVSCCKARFSTEAYQLYVKYQAGVHDDTSTSPTGYTRFLVETPLNRSPSVSR
mgnify:CR=1 FL=1